MQRRTLLAVAGVVALLFATAAWLTIPSVEGSSVEGGSPAAASIGGAFTLTDQDGRQVTERDLLGKPSVIFFGFTSCPDICPTTLLDLTDWLKELGADSERLNVVFVSVDSERDTPQQIKLYLSSFDPRIRGFVGTEEQIRRITDAYHVFYRRVALDRDDFTYDHSALIYLMDSRGRYLGQLHHGDPGDVAVPKLRHLATGDPA